MTKRKPLKLVKQVNLQNEEIDPSQYQDFANKTGAAVKSWETGNVYKVKEGA
jgi:hypothetical protein